MKLNTYHMEGYCVLNVHVMNVDGSIKQINFIADTTTTWYKIRSFICNEGGDLYYLYYDNQVINDDELVMPLIETIDDLSTMVCATTERAEYLKRVKQMKKMKPKRVNYRSNFNHIPYEEDEMVDCY